MRGLPRPENWVEVTLRLHRFLFPDLEIVAAEVAWYRDLHRGSDDPPPCVDCPPRVVYYCQEVGCECRAYRRYVVRDLE